MLLYTNIYLRSLSNCPYICTVYFVYELNYNDYANDNSELTVCTNIYEECSKFSHEMIVFPFFSSVPYIADTDDHITSQRKDRPHITFNRTTTRALPGSGQCIFLCKWCPFDVLYNFKPPFPVCIRERRLCTQRLTCMFAGCCVLQIDSSPGQRSILLSLFYGWQKGIMRLMFCTATL